MNPAAVQPVPTRAPRHGRVFGLGRPLTLALLLALAAMSSQAEALGACAPGQATVPQRDLYVLIGQSNAAGLASVRDVRSPLHEPVQASTLYPQVQLYGVHASEPGVAGHDEAQLSPAIDWRAKASWQPAGPGFGFKNLAGNEVHFPAGTTVLELFGPEVPLAALLSQQPPHPQHILKLAVANTSLSPVADADSWAPGGRLYQQLLHMLADAHQLKLDEARLQVRAVFFLQGESDAMRPERASAYAANLRRFIQTLRQDMRRMGCSRQPDVLFVLGRIQANPDLPYSPQVRQAQEKISRTVPQVILLDTDDLPGLTMGGITHFRQASQAVLGQRLYRALSSNPRQLAYPARARRLADSTAS